MSDTTRKPPFEQITVLLVEDSLIDALMIKHLLVEPKNTSFKFVHVQDLSEALAAVGMERVDCILLDMMLPDSTGIETLLRLQEAAPAVPVVVLTGIKDEELSLACIDKGAQDYLVKQEIDRNNLVRTIRHAMERQRMLIELRHAYQIEQYLSTHDPLTGLPNRHLFFDRLSQAMSHASRYNSRVAVLFIDLNRFKSINDSMGHQAGDHLLQATAKRLSLCVRKSDTVARYGGDEFVILLTNVNRLEDVDAVAQKIIQRMGHGFRSHTHEFFVSLSIGISIYPDDANTSEELLKRADMAMFHAKKYGGNMYVYYQSDLEEESPEVIGTENNLVHALKKNEFLLHYQPQFDLQKNAVIGVEALIRWNHPKQGMVLPSRFIGCAEQTGLILPIGEWVFHSVCMQNRTWKSLGCGPYRIAVNLSPRQFRNADLPEILRRELDQVGLQPDSLEVEVTESNLMQNLDSSARILKELKDLGIRISIDDFGTGYSSLQYLKKLPVDALKIDQCFISQIAVDKTDMAITRSVLALADSLDLEVIAEGVETQEQVGVLRSLGCRYIQGYYFSPPLPSEDIPNIMECCDAPSRN